MSNNNPDQKMVLTLADLQEVLNYISTRPYAEVFKVVEVLKKSRTLDSILRETSSDTPTPKAVTEETPVAQEA